MRKISFRAWDRIDKEMFVPESLPNPIKSMGNSLIYLQFTGVLDRKGKEIYESDIVKVQNEVDSRNAKIIYEGSCFSVSVLTGENLPHARIDMLNDICEVIGNIFENKELLN